MSFWTDLRLPAEHELLVGFYDLHGYMRYAEASEPRPLLDLMTGYFACTGQIGMQQAFPSQRCPTCCAPTAPLSV